MRHRKTKRDIDIHNGNSDDDDDQKMEEANASNVSKKKSKVVAKKNHRKRKRYSDIYDGNNLIQDQCQYYDKTYQSQPELQQHIDNQHKNKKNDTMPSITKMMKSTNSNTSSQIYFNINKTVSLERPRKREKLHQKLRQKSNIILK